MNKLELEKLLNKDIPISLAHEAHISQLTDDLCEISVPLKPNVNHKGTVFGGSLYVACTFASYGLFISSMQKNLIYSNNIVISKGEIKYFAPVTDNFTVQAAWLDAEERRIFFEALIKTGKAKICLKAKIFLNFQVVGEFIGHFVAFDD